MKRTLTLIGALGLVGVGVLADASPALAWEPFRARNQNVQSGNAAMAEQDPSGALRSYDAAAAELPNEGGVHLDRGLALLGSGESGPAREAFLRAASPEGSDEVRAAAFYNMGLSFYLEGDAAAAEDDHETAQSRFREAADAFRRSLRTVPGNRDAAWNLELALRRMNEEQEQQEREEQEQQEREEQEQQEREEQEQQDQQDGEPEDGEPQDGEPQDGEPEDGEPQDGEPQDGEPQDGEPQDGDQDGDEQQEQQGGDSQGDEESEGSQDDTQQPDTQQPDTQQPDQPQDGEGTQEQAEEGQEGPGGQDLPRHVERVLDNLQDDEESLERHRARARAARERRRPLRDW